MIEHDHIRNPAEWSVDQVVAAGRAVGARAMRARR